MHRFKSRKITRRNLLRSGLMSLVGLNLRDRGFGTTSSALDANRDEFLNPPDSARPWVYWYFMDGNLTADGMTADLESMKRAGIGGGVYLEVGIGIAPGPVQFMSEAWQQLVAQAFSHADELGIEIALAAGAGWCGAGGPWIKPEESMQFLSTSETRIAGPARFDAQLPRPQARTPFFGEDTLTPELRAEWNDFYVDEFVLAFPASAGDARIADIDEKALYTRGSYSSQILGPFTKRPWVRPFLPSSTSDPAVPARNCIAQAEVHNLTSRMTPDGRLAWDVPAGDWIIMRAGRTITAQTTRPAPRSGIGLESDKFSREAIDHHFDAYFAKLLERIGPHRHANSGLTTLHYDSWEMSSQNWTAQFQSEFEQRRGYSPAPFLPAFRGYMIDNEQTTERFLWDIRQTAQELVIENQATRLRDLGHRNGLQLALEPYDLNPCSDLELGAVADVPMAEFWSRFGDINTDWSVVESTSVAHTNGRRIVAAEAFTAEQADHWLQHPASMKNQGDWAFCAGINRIVFHRFQSQPCLHPPARRRRRHLLHRESRGSPAISHGQLPSQREASGMVRPDHRRAPCPSRIRRERQPYSGSDPPRTFRERFCRVPAQRLGCAIERQELPRAKSDQADRRTMGCFIRSEVGRTRCQNGLCATGRLEPQDRTGDQVLFRQSNLSSQFRLSECRPGRHVSYRARKGLQHGDRTAEWARIGHGVV